ncbi:MAG: HAMP domain-containing histidine kinase [Planctomycetaceae bacterium]|nr:HAMP domain-containing histidine kinase [Planctomycetaceae bacterium]
MQRSASNNQQMFESSLELKCLFFFGVAMLIVITVSFRMYWSVTDALIKTQNETMARSLAKEHLVFEHVRKDNADLDSPLASSLVPPASTLFTASGRVERPLDDSGYRKAITQLLGSNPEQTRVIRRPESFVDSRIPPEKLPQNQFEEELLEQFRKSPNLASVNQGVTLIGPEDIQVAERLVDQVPPLPQPAGRPSVMGPTPLEIASEMDADVKSAPQFVAKMDNNGHYRYYEPRWAEAGICLTCHRFYSPDLEPGDLIGIVEVIIVDPPSKAVTDEYWVSLLVASILTATLAMLAFYIIIRWIIIKPLRHLRRVSDAISRGDISQRADLHTGDEFESLALAFNRTVRHILNSQEKLRGINVELDQRIDQLARLNMQLYESNRTKSDFMATMSHELRTPLNSIIGFSEVLSSIDSLDDKQKRYVDNISKSGKTLLGMINDILDMAKIEAGRIVVQPETFAIASIVGAQCDMAKPLGDRKNIDINDDIPDHLPPMHQDATRLQQILNNLLSNAIKFTPEGGRIKVQVRRIKSGTESQTATVHASYRQPMLEMKVIDTGVGIPEEDQQIIFEKFRQGKSSMAEGDAMKREYSGSGLGLSIVKELCRLLDGSVSVESRLGLGSTFTVLLPWTLEPKTRIESEIMADLQEFAKQKPRTKTHEVSR